jgi:hypothetical protein
MEDISFIYILFLTLIEEGQKMQWSKEKGQQQ